MNGVFAFVKRKINGARRYSAAELFLVPAALALLALARAAILIAPLKFYRPVLGRPCSAETRLSNITAAQRMRARSIGRVVRATATLTPWNAVCLPQALAAAILLRCAAVPFVTFFGLASGGRRSPDDPMKAHAWVQAGDLTVTGGPVDPHYAPVAAFQADSPS